MASSDERGESWTDGMRAQQSSLDLGADLGPADPTAYTTRREIPKPVPLERHGPARIIAMANQKGGVGKTTTTINLGAALAEYGRKVLLVDFDPQGALSVGLGVNPHNLDLSIYNLIMQDEVTIEDILIKTNVAGLHLLPANIDLSAAEIQLVTEVAREMALARLLRPVLKDYDFILIDCQPSLGLLAINALTCAHGVLVPLECEFFSLRGVALLLDTIDKVRERLNFDLELEGILATMYDSRTTHSRQVLQRVVEAFGDKVYQTDRPLAGPLRRQHEGHGRRRSPPSPRRRHRPGRPGLVPPFEGAVFARGALRLDPDPPLQEDAQAGPRMRVEVGHAGRREVDPVAADEPVAGESLGQLLNERPAPDARGAVVRLVTLDVVDHVVAVLGLDARGVIRQVQDQWKVWPPSITIVWPVTKSECGPQRKTTAPTTSCGTWSRCEVRAATDTSRSFATTSGCDSMPADIGEARRDAVDEDVVLADLLRERRVKATIAPFDVT